MGDFTKVLSKQDQFRDYITGDVEQNPNQFGNPYRIVDKKKTNVLILMNLLYSQCPYH